MSLKHAFVSQVTDGADSTKLRPSNWGSASTNYATTPTHVFDGGALGGLLYRDTGAVDGANWLADVAAGSVLASGGVGAAPAWTATPTLTGVTLTGGTITGASSLRVFTLPDQAVFPGSIYMGNGGALCTRATGVGINPVDPLSFESDGSFNGLYNTFVGIDAGIATTGGNELVFIGTGAGQFNVNGDQDTFVGFQAGYSNTSGYHNTFVGVWAGYKNTTGYFNTFVGTDICITNAVTGFANTVVGASCFGVFSGGESNTAIGSNTGSAMTTGSHNTLIGKAAGEQLTTGTFNTMVGRGAGSITSGIDGVAPTTAVALTFLGSRTTIAAGAEAATQATCIGDSAQITRSSQVVLGRAATNQIKAHGDVFAIGASSVGSESLTNPNLTSGTSWTRTGDFALTGDAAVYTHSSGTGTLSQASGTLAIAGRTNRWYRFTYTVSSVTGSPTARVTTFGNGAPQETWALDLTAGSHTLWILCNAGNFTITGTSAAAATFTLDTFSLKEVQAGDLNIGGTLRYGSWNTQTTVGAAGGASALPATPLGYIKATIDGTAVVIPYYTQ